MWCKVARRRESIWCHWHHRLAQVGFRARRLIEVIRNFLYEMVLSNNKAANNDVNAAVDDVRVQAIECLIRTCNFIRIECLIRIE